MLKIRQDQLDVLSDVALQKFVNDLAQDIYQERAKSKRFNDVIDVRAFVNSRVPIARNLGFTTKGEIRKFIEVALVMGANFYESDWAKSILGQDVFPSTKVSLLEQYALEELNSLETEKEELRRAADDLIIEKFVLMSLDKVKTIGAVLYSLKFETELALKEWLIKVGFNAIERGYRDELELNIWLDLSMAHGLEFANLAWANTDQIKELDASKKLMHYMEVQPKA